VIVRNQIDYLLLLLLLLDELDDLPELDLKEPLIEEALLLLLEELDFDGV
jgi:hypothetical protein